MAVSLSEVVSFGRYEPLFRIASGGMAEVYAARIRGEAGFQKLVAVKRMHPHLATDPVFVDMFLNEARLAANIASPHVVQTLDLGRGSDGALYIVMELVVGLSLAHLFDARPGASLPIPYAVELIAQAAQGLDDAHEATTPAGDPLGLIHRDISPHNLLLGLDGRARLTDFGIAHAIHRPREETNIKELKGKFAYMSPEQTRLKPLDARSDIFSLGVVLWECLVGSRLFADRDPTISIRNVRGRAIPPPQSINEKVPPALGRVVLRALERDASLRFASAASFGHELRRVGRETLGELPGRKMVAKYVRKAGGDELERLQRLIRLGTEGADVEAIEQVKPGITRVLASENASGVARLDTGKKRVTHVLGGDGSEGLSLDLPSVSAVLLGRDDDEPERTRTAYVVGGDEPPTALHENPTSDAIPLHTEELERLEVDAEDDPTRERPADRPVPPEGPTGAWARAEEVETFDRDPKTTPREAADSDAEEGTYVPPTTRRGWMPWLVTAFFFAGTCVALGVGAMVMILEDGPRVTLPDAPPGATLAPPRHGPLPDPALPGDGPAAPTATAETPPAETAAGENVAVEDRATPELGDDDSADDDSAVDESADDDSAAVASPTPPEPEPRQTRPTPRRRTRGRARRATTPETPGDLMGVDAFDRHRR